MATLIERKFAGRTLIMEAGRMARQADGAVLVQFGETTILATVVAEKKPTQLPFFPLTVEYREKSYAAGKIPGGFFKREGRPGEKEVLSARQIDRSIRPLFPKGFNNETQVVITILSADQENDADVLGLLGASAALNLSNVPFPYPIAGVRVGRLEGEWVLNPTFQQLEFSDVDLIVAGSAESIVMVEGGALEISDDELVDALEFAHQGIRELVAIQKELVEPLAKPKMEWTPLDLKEALVSRVQDLASQRVDEALNLPNKEERSEALSALRKDIIDELADDFEEIENYEEQVNKVVDQIEYETLRAQILGKRERVDGRTPEEVRSISCEIGLLPRTHGSALFTRGSTQSLSVVTLGTSRDEQRIDTIDVLQETSKSFMLHYNFPPFSVGEVRMFRGTSRREIGHGALAERALQPLLPAYEDFPYTIRVVSDILESNGSSSMATVCGGSLALMQAGVPVRAACAGVAMGMIKEGDRVEILTDIMGIEDHLGDMDFKVAGTRQGITSVQMDIKVEGISTQLLREAMARAREARNHILDIMDKTLAEPRSDLSPTAPRIITLQVNPEKIGEVIGPKGKTIRGIEEQTGAEVNIEDSGLITISSVSGEAGEKAREIVEAIVQEPEIGRVYEGVVKNTTSFGAFVEILPGVEALCHISELEEGRVEKTEDVVKRGDTVKVKLISIDDRGRMRLSRRAAMSSETEPETAERS
ncbi:MAG: polyribonucleotide nucleotidyltransferase [Gemmatimonadota bacterium]|nr:MAG: polyribonucleotide nucleotidyltransferase [Gemmatimonadota bacterium]